MNPSTLQSMDEHVLMCQTGYLTLKAPVSIYDDISLGVPNEEIRRAMLIGLARYCFTRRPKLTKEEWEILKNGDVKDCVVWGKVTKGMKLSQHEFYVFLNITYIVFVIHRGVS